MLKVLRTYKAFTRAGILQQVAYRANFLCFLVGEIMKCFVMFFIWKAVFDSSGGNTLFGFSFMNMVLYTFITFLSGYMTYSDGTYAIGEEILDGSIAMRMIKPVNFDVCFLFQELGNKVMNLVLCFVPILVGVEAYRWYYSGHFSLNLTHFALFLISMVLAYLINFYFNVCYGFLSFYLKNLWGTGIVKEVIVDFLSGATVPLAFMGGFGFVLQYLPFASLSYTPVMLYMGMYSWSRIALSMGLQVFWLVAMFLLSRFIYNRATKRLVVHGG